MIEKSAESSSSSSSRFAKSLAIPPRLSSVGLKAVSRPCSLTTMPKSGQINLKNMAEHIIGETTWVSNEVCLSTSITITISSDQIFPHKVSDHGRNIQHYPMHSL